MERCVRARRRNIVTRKIKGKRRGRAGQKLASYPSKGGENKSGRGKILHENVKFIKESRRLHKLSVIPRSSNRLSQTKKHG